MFSFSKVFFLALLASIEANFQGDVVANGSRIGSPALERKIAEKFQQDFSKLALNKKMADPTSDLHQNLLAKAMPIAQFEEKYGVDLQSESSQGEHRDLADNAMISFSGYSLKFAKCQPVQYFSERALQMGEHSPMITNDIVVLRLCPTSSCSSTTEYGCNYNFAEYAMELAEYLRVMLDYAAAKRDYMCGFCNTCLQGGRKLEEDNNNQNGQNQNNDNQNGQNNNGQDQQQEENQNVEAEDEGDAGNQNVEAQEYEAEQADEAQAAEAQADYASSACSSWSTYCGDYATQCVEQDQQNGEVYLGYEDYENYLYCSQLNYNNYAYFVKPRCDGYQGTIKMGIFYDKYCSQYAGNEVSLKNTGMGFKESAFQEFYSSTCMDCSESEYPPYDAASTMCNNLHYTAAKCTDDMTYNLFGNGQTDDSTECSYIESIRFGTYNEVGQLTTRYADGTYAEKMTEGQEVLLGITIAFSIALVVYACYLHHAMTNLLIKSLSHRELLPPSRHASRSRVSAKRSGRKLKRIGNEPDWDDEDEPSGEYA